MRRATLLILLAIGVALILLIARFDHPVERVVLSFDTEPIDTPAMVAFVTSTLDQYGANATFFVTGEFAQAHPLLTKELAQKYEVACHTMTHPHLPEINDTQLRWELAECKRVVENLTGKPVKGFRAPYNLIDERTFALLQTLNYTYDASTFENLGWFYPPPNMTELPTSSLGILPLEDWPLLHYFHLGDFAYFLMREDHDAEVRLDLHPREVWHHRGAFQYLVSSYADDGVTFLTNAAAAED